MTQKKTDHDCLHEQDFGIVFTKLDMVGETLKSHTITNDALKVAIDAALKFITSMEAINGVKKAKKDLSLQKAILYSSIILSVAAIVTTLIIEFH